jgi:hypothetical protein
MSFEKAQYWISETKQFVPYQKAKNRKKTGQEIQESMVKEGK